MVTLLCITLLSLAGCSALSNKWTTEVIEHKERGSVPENYKQSINAYLEDVLKDPFSKKLKDMTEPKEGFHATSEVIKSPTLINVNGTIREVRTHGWLVSVDVNAKNSYGAYGGWTKYQFTFRGEEIIAVEDGS